ncbi:Nn.00g006370.m01.CDS01 [Neocucurbitaria sp. VM-36]
MSDKDQEQAQNSKAGGEEHTHIPTESKEEEKDEGSGGLLSFVGDPAGKVLGTALRPLGAPLEKGVTGPLGEAVGGTTRSALGPLMGTEDQKSELLGGKNKDSYESKPEKIAGKEQTGDNPLGLDQTGRWGFQDESKGPFG